MASAANALKLYVKTTSPADVEADGINNVSGSLAREPLDTTDFAGGAFRTRIMGLKDIPLSFSGDSEFSDAAQTALQTACNAGSAVFVRVLWDGTNGFEAQFMVENITRDSSVEGKNEVSYSLVSISDITFVP
jgi:predicted secreted protein